ncbi:hypothetical protein VP01_4288g2 [Puccinia sorghi]|uniref:Uncharacterized protein n=1 Tax=Puccinia sorghi TaxID=27349 RepID=A0A0L6US58_9BASI|nr:hypothetical protein VP01_4288g2 [Puccinia sorghi]
MDYLGDSCSLPAMISSSGMACSEKYQGRICSGWMCRIVWASTDPLMASDLAVTQRVGRVAEVYNPSHTLPPLGVPRMTWRFFFLKSCGGTLEIFAPFLSPGTSRPASLKQVGSTQGALKVEAWEVGFWRWFFFLQLRPARDLQKCVNFETPKSKEPPGPCFRNQKCNYLRYNTQKWNHFFNHCQQLYWPCSEMQQITGPLLATPSNT